MKIPNILTLAAFTVILVSPLNAQEAAPATAEPAKTEAIAPVAPETAAVETTAATTDAAAAPATAAAAQPHRPLPKVRHGTPFTGSRGHMITYSILFFLLSVIMALVLLRSKEDIPA